MADSKERHVEENCMFSFKTPQLDNFESASKKGSICDLCESDQCTSSIWSNIIKMDRIFGNVHLPQRLLAGTLQMSN